MKKYELKFNIKIVVRTNGIKNARLLSRSMARSITDIISKDSKFFSLLVNDPKQIKL